MSGRKSTFLPHCSKSQPALFPHRCCTQCFLWRTEFPNTEDTGEDSDAFTTKWEMSIEMKLNLIFSIFSTTCRPDPSLQVEVFVGIGPY